MWDQQLKGENTSLLKASPELDKAVFILWENIYS